VVLLRHGNSSGVVPARCAARYRRDPAFILRQVSKWYAFNAGLTKDQAIEEMFEAFELSRQALPYVLKAFAKATPA
jgi:hypothetical protein